MVDYTKKWSSQTKKTWNKAKIWQAIYWRDRLAAWQIWSVPTRRNRINFAVCRRLHAAWFATEQTGHGPSWSRESSAVGVPTTALSNAINTETSLKYGADSASIARKLNSSSSSSSSDDEQNGRWIGLLLVCITVHPRDWQADSHYRGSCRSYSILYTAACGAVRTTAVSLRITAKNLGCVEVIDVGLSPDLRELPYLVIVIKRTKPLHLKWKQEAQLMLTTGSTLLR